MSRQGQNIGRKKYKMIVFPCPVRDKISVERNVKLSILCREVWYVSSLRDDIHD